MQPDHAVIVPPGGGVRFGNVEFLGLSEHSPRVNVSVITMAPGRTGPDSHVHQDEDDVFYGHVLGCKGLERRAVVLCVNAKTTDRAREMLYVGMSRATDQLVVVGDPHFIREIGGDQVAHRLGIG